MDLLHVLLILIVIGVVLYLIETIPMDATIKVIIRVVVILFVVIWLLSVFGIGSGLYLGPHR
jgi:hypothetical protein